MVYPLKLFTTSRDPQIIIFEKQSLDFQNVGIYEFESQTAEERFFQVCGAFKEGGD